MVIEIEEFMKIATPEQRQLLFDLSDLAEKEKDLVYKINKIYSTTDGIYSDGKGITLCEDEDDADIISLGHKMELKDVRDNIVILLKKAINELGMKDVGIIQRQYKNYVKK